MKRIQNNLCYFELSQRNPEKAWDSFYVFEEKHPRLSEYIANTKKIKNILITIKTLQDRSENKKIIAKYFLELSKTLGEFSNCSEFACFINACDSLLEFAKRDIFLLEKITQSYFQNRNLNEAVPEEWVQAIIDSNSSRKKGERGERKLLNILGELGFQEVENWETFSNKNRCVAKFSKIFSVKSVRENLGIRMDAKNQNKQLDLIIRAKKKIFLCEAKHLNTSGGGQNKQISELIKIVGLKEKNKNICYLVFLDGSYSNIFLSEKRGGKKLETQRKDTKRYLTRNPNSFWVNTAGFRALFRDEVGNRQK